MPKGVWLRFLSQHAPSSSIVLYIHLNDNPPCSDPCRYWRARWGSTFHYRFSMHTTVFLTKVKQNPHQLYDLKLEDWKPKKIANIELASNVKRSNKKTEIPSKWLHLSSYNITQFSQGHRRASSTFSHMYYIKFITFKFEWTLIEKQITLRSSRTITQSLMFIFLGIHENVGYPSAKLSLANPITYI